MRAARITMRLALIACAVAGLAFFYVVAVW